VNVSAVIVTRGDVPLGPILDTLVDPRIDDVIVWDNSVRHDVKTWGRHAALAEARHRVIYSQDDDLVHTPEAIGRILDAYAPGVLTGCMWPAWSDNAARQGIAGGYSDLAFPGSGSVYDREVPLMAATRYLALHPFDDFFRTWCDAVIGVLAPTAQLDERFRTLPAAFLPDRLSRTDTGGALKREAMERGRAIRDSAASPAPRAKRPAREVYMDEFTERMGRLR
jgi:hypothetical protein